jgi:putative membrane protein insertion efficiency factor
MPIPDIPADRDEDPPLRSLALTWRTLPRLPLLVLIRFYQLTFARLIPPDTCRFTPTCSHYGYQAVFKHGLWKGGRLAVWRLLRCQPLVPGGYDPVP